MIVRVLGEGQWVLELEHLEALNAIDVELEAAVEAGDEERMRAALVKLYDGIRELGTEVPDEVIVESDMVLPDPSSSLEEVKVILEANSEQFGLIPDAPAATEEG
ncbi:hypothetical protein [Tessaracoccus sp. OH4464_COT-324]|uniref:PspA-associated protein PspAA n=1 Tax=Tessaracoccus sp. OH4464_COT-324 TaxID=2491059 RepID=UPI000F640E8E|nr:hypothetical protein [Tessaracoccus sp. OH4464_COT-324]RRD45763.1 hypothetical protein EII42_10210 [Tessaracoccus sp. OH4464_COT-324]